MMQSIKKTLIERKSVVMLVPFISFFLVAFWLNVNNTAHFNLSLLKNILKNKKSRPHNPPKIIDPTKKRVNIQQQVKSGDTIITTLTREGLDYTVAHKFFTEVKRVYDLKKIGAGKHYAMTLTYPGPTIEAFSYQIDINQTLEVVYDALNDCFNSTLITIPYETKKELIKGSIDVSLFASILDCGEKAEFADILASLFEYDIDFNRDIKKDDSFAVIVEKKYLNGQFVAYGPIEAAEFSNNGVDIRIIRYTDPEGKTSYYHPDGRSVQKMFLRCPLPFMRITSRFGNRHHPILGYSKMHCGVDFAAPTGTKVRASATGTVYQAGYNSGNGKYVYIRHPNKYVSQYLHLSRIDSSIKSGSKVSQGQVIGYVGSTGLSTGPHLHYGLVKNGISMNPLSLNSPSVSPVKSIYMNDFLNYTAAHFLVLTSTQIAAIPQPLKDVFLNSTGNRLPISEFSSKL